MATAKKVKRAKSSPSKAKMKTTSSTKATSPKGSSVKKKVAPTSKGKVIKSKAHGKTSSKAVVKPLKSKPHNKLLTDKLVPHAAPAKKRADGLPEKLRDAALSVLDGRQAEDIVTLDLTGRSSVTDYVIVASGRASRQVAAIAHYLSEAFEKLGSGRVRIEGLQEGNWVLVDAGDVIVHLFRPEVRQYYNLEQMWADRERHRERDSNQE